MRSMPATALAAAAVFLSIPGDAKDRAEGEKVCIALREINAISALDERHAFAKLSASRFYLLTLDQSCRGLRSARAIAVVRSGPRICGDGTSLLSFEEPGEGLKRCRIEKMDAVANKDEALSLIESRSAGPR